MGKMFTDLKNALDEVARKLGIIPPAVARPSPNEESLNQIRLDTEKVRKANEKITATELTSVQKKEETERTSPESDIDLSEVDEFAKKADREYFQNANAPKSVVKQKRVLRYKYPNISFLTEQVNQDDKARDMELYQTADLLIETLRSFGVNAKIVNISRGPVVTRYEFQPESGVRLSRIVQLSDDIAMNLAATSIRIEAPIPGKNAFGIEVPNHTAQPVRLRSIIESEDFQQSKATLAFALGKDVSGAVMVGDIEKMPHLLIGGATGMGKTVCINSILISLLYKYSPEQLRMILIDPKMVEFGAYNGLPHLFIPVVTDPRKAVGALSWAVGEMLKRYRLFSATGNQNITEFNNWVTRKQNELDYIPPEGINLELLPRVVIVIDELAVLMQVAANEVEDAISRLAAMARAAGMHLIVATQRPSTDVITRVVKNNLPSRIAFAVSSWVDSRTILDGSGAEKLLGRGDMLYQPVGATKPVRIQGSLVEQDEVDRVVSFIKNYNSYDYGE